MEQFVFNDADHCIICNNFLELSRNSLQITTSSSEKRIFNLIETFLEVPLPDTLLDNASVCQICTLKVNEYENLITKANQAKDELIDNIKNSQNSIRMCQESLKFEALDENFQLNENFPEIECDFELRNLDLEIAKSEEISENFAKIIEKEGIKYDIEVFHKVFGDVDISETEKQAKTSKDESFTCNICESTEFKSRKMFLSHLKTHRKSKFYCEICKIYFKADSSLKIHVSSDHGNLKKNIPCPFESCQKTFRDKVSLRAHLICHNKDDKDPSFFCDQCGKRFFYKISFTQHQKIHSGIRDKQCEICGFKAISSTHLQRHIRARHTKEKNHICTFCGRAFSERYNMMSHMRKQHIEKKPKEGENNFFKCIVCNMEYSEAVKLKMHLEASHNILEVDSEEVVA